MRRKMMKGFFNRILRIDASGRSHHVDPIDDVILERYLGGKGLCTRGICLATKAYEYTYTYTSRRIKLVIIPG